MSYLGKTTEGHRASQERICFVRHGYYLLDPRSRKQADALMEAADAAVIAMRRSPYSELIDTNKMYEYMALRKPLIISRLRPITLAFDESCVKFIILPVFRTSG